MVLVPCGQVPLSSTFRGLVSTADVSLSALKISKGQAVCLVNALYESSNPVSNSRVLMMLPQLLYLCQVMEANAEILSYQQMQYHTLFGLITPSYMMLALI